MTQSIARGHLKRAFRVTDKPPTVWKCGRTGRGGSSPGCIYLQCSSDLVTGVLCKNEIYILSGELSVNGMTDEEAATVLKRLGWTIKPTVCPECVKTLAEVAP